MKQEKERENEGVLALAAGNDTASEVFSTGESFGLSAARHQSWGLMMMAHAKAKARVGRRVEAEGGLSLDWYDVLLVLEYAPQERLRMGQLGEYIALSRSGLTRLIDRMEAAGYVKRHLCPQDRRAFETVLTAKGRKAREKSWPLYARAIAEGFGNHYSDEEAAQLSLLLGRQLTSESGSEDGDKDENES